jgi:hypothetical protein
MELDRRRLIVAGGAVIAGGPGWRAVRVDPAPLDRLLEAHADALPERVGAGANHYPMAAEVLEALGHEEAIEEGWVRGAEGYAGALPRAGAIEGLGRDALGDYEGRFGDWLDHFRGALGRESWQAVVRTWAPRLAGGLVGATFHGLIRTAHAVRALRRARTPARLGELAVGLAYWAARYVELPTREGDPGAGDLRTTLPGLEHPWLDDETDVPFDDVLIRMTERPIAPSVQMESGDVRAGLDALVREAALAFLEMLVQERHRIWLLHTVTGPAAIDLLLPELDDEGARLLLAHARQAVVALYTAYGAPYTAGAHLREAPGEWPDLIEQAASSRSVHTIKLLEALRRFDHDPGDMLVRSVAAQWLEWK